MVGWQPPLEVHEPLSRNRAEFEFASKVPLPSHASAAHVYYQRMTLDTKWVGVLERRSGMPVVSLARAGPPLNILSHCWFSWPSICISSECHGRGLYFNEPLALRLSSKVINLFSKHRRRLLPCVCKAPSIHPRRVFSVEMIFEMYQEA